VKVLLDTHVWLWWRPKEFHGDPADRLIVATALTHGLVLATHDQAIRDSGVVKIWKGLRE
jgi:PIN domain nuclease of toxin-antitoxin system